MSSSGLAFQVTSAQPTSSPAAATPAGAVGGCTPPPFSKTTKRSPCVVADVKLTVPEGVALGTPIVVPFFCAS
jgi:hypothetical protein